MVRLFNVFAVPGMVFDEVRSSPARFGNWLLPAVLWAAAVAAFGLVVVSQPEIQTKLRDNLSQTLEKQVASGKMTQADVTRTKQALEVLVAPAVAVMAMVLSFLRVFWWAFILWLFGLMFLRARFPYVKALEVVGLAVMISVLGTIVAVLLSVDMGQIFSGQHPDIAAGQSALDRHAKLIAGAGEVFSIWMLVVMSVGLSKLSGAPILRAAWLVFAWWLMQRAFFLMLGAGQMGM